MNYRYLDDDFVGRHWRHHPQFEARHSGRRWRFEVARVSISSLHTRHDQLGTSEAPQGLMGSVGGSPNGYRGHPVRLLVDRIRSGLESGQADRENPALRKLLFFRDLGAEGIGALDEPMAFFQQNGMWFIMEGAHRTIALALCGASEVEGLQFLSAQLAAADSFFTSRPSLQMRLHITVKSRGIRTTSSRSAFHG